MENEKEMGEFSEGDIAFNLPQPTIIGFESGAIVFPLGAATFAITMKDAGMDCDAINVDDECDVFIYSAKTKDWANVVVEQKTGSITTIGPKKIQ